MWLLLAACAAPMDFDPPQSHTVRQEGSLHARGYEQPLLCGGQTCPEDGGWPAESELSCDAYGCHGGNTYDGQLSGVTPTRHLRGSDGPSCWTCHDQEWSGRTTR